MPPKNIEQKPKNTRKMGAQIKNIKAVKYDSDSDSDDDTESESDNEIDIEQNIVEALGSPVYELKDQYGIHFPRISNFINNVKPYCYNNILNKEHVKQLIKTFKKNNKPLYGIFVTGTDQEGNIYLLDGHHRFEALKMVYGKNRSIKQNIQVHNYMIDEIHSKRTREIFNRINRVKPFNNDEELFRHVHNIVSKIRSKYPGCIKDNQTQKPFVCMDNVILGLRNHFKWNSTDTNDIDDNEIFEKINEKNEELGYKDFGELSVHCNKLTQKQYDRMDDKRFYLSVLEPELWLN
jgi:hypothetical protein